MDNNQLELKKFLEEQLQWCKEQDKILEEIDSKLHEMKRIAEYAIEQKLHSEEIERLNGQLNELKSEIHSLEKQLQTVVH